MEQSTNELVLANLQVLLKEATTSREVKDRFRAKAYRNAIKAIKNLNYELESGADAAKLPGVGKKIAEKIQEIIDTGKLHQVEELGEDKITKTRILGQLAKIWGVGPVKAQELWNLGARSVDDVHKYKDNLTDNQLVGLKYYHDLQKRVPCEQVGELADKIGKVINKLAAEMSVSIKHRICGSFRRRVPTCGDMDLLLTEESGKEILKQVVQRLIEKDILLETLGLGPTKYMGITRTSDGTHFRIDMEVIKPHEWPFALLYFTGSGQFNERQRLLAKKKGYTLSEHGLRDVDTGEWIPLESERAIFEFLGMEYLPPWARA